MSELLKVDSKYVHHQLKDEDLEIGVGTRKAMNELKHSGRQRQCNLHQCDLIYAKVSRTEQLTC